MVANWPNEHQKACTQCIDGATECVNQDELEGVGWPATTLGLGTQGSYTNGGCHTDGGTAGKGACAARACTCETQFIQEALLLVVTNNQVDIARFGHANGFHPKYQCPLDKGTHDPRKQCCGQYPDRHPYKLLPHPTQILG